MKHDSLSRFSAQIPWGMLGAIVLLMSAGGVVAGSTWLSVQFIIDPRSVVWLNRFLPVAIRIPLSGDEPRTLAEVQAALKKAGLTTGDPLLVTNAKAKDAPDLLLPILKRQANCSIDCDRIVELRVYRSLSNSQPRSKNKEYVQMISQLVVEELDAAFVTAPLANAGSASQDSTRFLPFTTLERFEDKAPAQGNWLNLTGQTPQGDTTIAYGQVVHYNPNQTRFSTPLRWTSPSGEAPVWQKVSKGNPSALLVNQTIGLEPNFQLYQLRFVRDAAPREPRKVTGNPLQLQPLSLSEPALDNGGFVDALYLARNGLWSPAFEVLQSVKRQGFAGWSPMAQAQMDLVARHAQVTRSQSEKPWVSVSQQILVNLIDGRWARALQVFQAPTTDRAEIADLLKVDSGRLWKRVNAALRLNPTRPDVQTWGALILAAQQDQASAVAWLKKQPQAASGDRAQVLKALKQLSNALAPDSETSLTSPLIPQKSPQPASKTINTPSSPNE